jgi:hypothetical protein
MSWNYRIIATASKLNSYHEYSIHEVYYDENGIINSWTENSVGAHGDSKQELQEDLQRMLKASTLPVLKEIDGKLVEFNEVTV